MWTTRSLASGTAALALLLGPAVLPAAAAGPSPAASGDAAAPTEAGTSFRTATEIRQGQRATADASSGDYLYWSFAADTGQRATVRATVRPADTAARPPASTWQLDVYDGLRRRQACTHGASTRSTAAGAPSVELSCTLRTVRGWAEPWADDPLPGTYYVRLTAVGLAKTDLGLPVHAEVQVASADVGGSAAVDGSLAVPLVPGIATAADSGASSGADARTSVARLFSGEPEDGWASGRWTDRWLWTAAGGLLAALAGIGGYALTRGTGRPHRMPPGA
ncbi:hypothetical protein [Streptomyces sp. NPDC051211]|uniref:hypothetical protein n=1 Tax=Streptomyces sp. NPDC051211 TaxID=3154643 RepID=UPI003450CC11